MRRVLKNFGSTEEDSVFCVNLDAFDINNPYKYVDDSGNFPVLVVAVPALVVGGIQGYLTYQQTRNLNKAIISGSVAGGATALSIATLGAASTVAVAGGTTLRYVGTTLATETALAGIGGGESILQQTIVQDKGFNQISYGDVVVSAGLNSIGGSLIGNSPLPGIISRVPGQFYPSSQFGISSLEEAGSQTAQSLYSEFGELGVRKLINNVVSMPSISTTNNYPKSESRSRRSSSGSGGNGGGCGITMSCGNGCGTIMSCEH